MLYRNQDGLDDLFGSIENRSASSKDPLGDEKDKSAIGKRTKRTTFMEDLFGKPNKDSASTDFTLDEKYKKPQEPPQDKLPSGGKWSGSSFGLDSGLGDGGGRSRRRGNAILQSDASSNKTQILVNVDDIFNRVTKPPTQLQHENIGLGGGPTSQFSVIPLRKNEVSKQMEKINVNDGSFSRVEENNASLSSLHYANTPSETLSNNINMFAINNEKLMHEQALKMQEFKKCSF